MDLRYEIKSVFGNLRSKPPASTGTEVGLKANYVFLDRIGMIHFILLGTIEAKLFVGEQDDPNGSSWRFTRVENHLGGSSHYRDA